MIRHGALFALSLLVATSAFGDWLVTRDGGQVETLGPWEIQGKLVVFELPGGRLGSLALRDVDLDASNEATRAAAQPPREPTRIDEPEVEAVVIITDADVEHVYPEGDSDSADEQAADGGTDGQAAGDRSSPAEAENRLEVTSWNESANAEDNGLRIAGTLANTSDEAAANIRLTLRLLDREGEVLSSVPAVLSSTTLLPGQTTGFRANAPGVFTFDDLGFDISSLGLLTRGREEEDRAEPEDGER